MRRVKTILLIGMSMLVGVTVADEMQKIHIDIDELQSGEQLQPVGGLTSSGQPDAEEFKMFADAGYAAVVDLRGAAEDRGLDEAAVLEELGLAYITLPLSSPDAINYENAAVLDKILESIDGPVLVHCGSGNRVGALLALRESSKGASAEEALAFGRAAGMTGLEPVVRSRLAEKDK